MSVLERMVRAVERVRNRLLRASRALEAAGLRYAVIDGNAVAAWVATVDEAAVRNSRGVDILVEPEDSVAIADKVWRLISDGELRQEMGRQGRLYVERCYSWQVKAREILQVYRHVVQ